MMSTLPVAVSSMSKRYFRWRCMYKISFISIFLFFWFQT